MCPQCGAESARVHSRYRRNVAGLATAGQEVVLRLQVRQFSATTMAASDGSSHSGSLMNTSVRRNALIDAFILQLKPRSSTNATSCIRSFATTCVRTGTRWLPGLNLRHSNGADRGQREPVEADQERYLRPGEVWMRWNPMPRSL